MNVAAAPPRSKVTVRGVILIALYLYVAVLLSYVVFARGLANGSGTPAASPILSRTSTLKLVDGTAHRPFVFRRLAPDIVGAVHRMVPVATRQRIDRSMAADTTRNAFPGAAYHQANLMHSLAFLMWVASLTGFAAVMRAAFRVLHPGSAVLHEVGPVLCLLGVAAFGYVNFYVYDALTPLIFALAIFLATTGRNLLFWLLLVPAAYHKETAVALPVVYACFAVERLGLRRAVWVAAAQLSLVAAILAGLRVAFSGNPGEPMEIHVASNWHAITHPKPITLLIVVSMVGTVIAIRRAWPSLHVGVARCCLLLLPTAFPLYLVTGMFLELRSLLELWPLLCLVLIPPLFAEPADGEVARRDERVRGVRSHTSTSGHGRKRARRLSTLGDRVD